MDNLSRFYIDLATDVNKANAFHLASEGERRELLEQAGVEATSELLSSDQNATKEIMMANLSESTGSWKGLNNNAGNDDNKNNIGRLGRNKKH